MAVPVAPLVTTLTLALLTTWIWRMQVEHQRRLQSRHTADVCYQASRRIQVLVDYALKAVRRHTLLSRKILMAQEEERGRISRDLHDELGQILTALHLELDWLQAKTTSAPPLGERERKEANDQGTDSG